MLHATGGAQGDRLGMEVAPTSFREGQGSRLDVPAERVAQWLTWPPASSASLRCQDTATHEAHCLDLRHNAISIAMRERTR